jgi:hypothetical protein
MHTKMHAMWPSPHTVAWKRQIINCLENIRKCFQCSYFKSSSRVVLTIPLIGWEALRNTLSTITPRTCIEQAWFSITTDLKTSIPAFKPVTPDNKLRKTYDRELNIIETTPYCIILLRDVIERWDITTPYCIIFLRDVMIKDEKTVLPYIIFLRDVEN